MKVSMPASPHPSPAPAASQRSEFEIVKRLWPYVWQWKGRVIVALLALILAKSANLGVPVALKHLVDSLEPTSIADAAWIFPASWLLAYGLLRLSVVLFTEMREWLFYPVAARVARTVGLQSFEHLMNQSLRFHLERQTGGMTRDLDRGNRAILSLLTYLIYTIIPTLVEIGLVLVFLSLQFDWGFAVITGTALAAYIVFTVKVTEWRTHFRRAMNEQDSQASTKAIDALINYETVKYFCNEPFEKSRYDKSLAELERVSLKSQGSLSLLNIGQSSIIALAVVVLLWRATEGVVSGHMSLGDLVLVNALMIQLYIPLNFLGVIYREIKQSMVDMEKLWQLLERDPEVKDPVHATALPAQVSDLEFDKVSFSYEVGRPILHEVSFVVPAGQTVAVVGPSGSGKSTLARLVYRFYEVGSGAIKLGGVDIRSVTQSSLRAAIGIVPQDTVLFNDSLAYNIGYGKAGASQEAIEAVSKAAHVHDFIASTPKGYDTQVGERGLKLSGGEKQRVAIARTLLKNPPLMIFDEATSALDSANERAIQAEIEKVSEHRTTLIIAHRLSTIIHADQILVMRHGRIVERGTHQELLALDGQYATMWRLQLQGQSKE